MKNSKLQVALVGWRGMVGSVLVQRMKAEGDFDVVDIHYFSTSQAGQAGPDKKPLGDAYSDKDLISFDAIITCQGSDYTNKMHSKLRQAGWNGYWIDAASALRMENSAVLVLDPVNGDFINKKLDSGVKDLIGANCTVSTMLMGIGGLLKSNEVEWISSMTYQAASGAGARNMKELLSQMYSLGQATQKMVENPSTGILEIDTTVSKHLASSDFPLKHWPAPLAANILPWIDALVEGGQSREEWKGMTETNKILGSNSSIAVDGTCVRVGTMRSHAQGLTIKLKRDIPIKEIETMISSASQWVKLVPNTPEESVKHLTPAAVSGGLDVAVGRVRKMNIGPEYLNAFVVGDQLLWGAAEPLRRALRIIASKI